MKSIFLALSRLGFVFLAASAITRAALPSGALAKPGDPGDPVTRAMRDELARSMAQLQLENLEKPYFISYHVQDVRSEGVGAQFGSALGRSEGPETSRWIPAGLNVRPARPRLVASR